LTQFSFYLIIVFMVMMKGRSPLMFDRVICCLWSP